jgi:transcriptional regulator with XRE-family HTH domain
VTAAEDFSHRVRKYREHEGISQEELAQRLGMSRNYVSMIEGGREPSDQVVRHFALLEAAAGIGTGLAAKVPEDTLRSQPSVQESEADYETVKHIIFIEEHGTPEQIAAARAFVRSLREQVDKPDQSGDRSQ